MKFVTFNIQYGLGADGRYDLSRVAEAVRGADVIALQEVDRYWKRSGLVDQPALIADSLPGYYWVYGPGLDMDASFHDEKEGLVNRRKQFGNMLLSKRPFVSTRNFPLPKFGAINHHSIQQAALEGVINLQGWSLRIYSINLSHLVSIARQAQVKALLDIHRNAPAEGGAWCGNHPDPESGWLEEPEPPMPGRAIMMGDFNMAFSAPEYELLVGPQTERFGRINSRKGFTDSWVLAGNSESEGETCPAKAECSPDNERIDYCFVTTSLSSFVRQARIDTDCQASDHKPYWVELNLDAAQVH